MTSYPFKNILGIVGLLFEGEYRFTKKMVADYYSVDELTIDRLLEVHGDELALNGYAVLEDKAMGDFKLRISHIEDMDNKATQIGLFNFPSLINIGMLLIENEKAQTVRNKILDLIISSINERTGGGSRYVNPCEIYPLPDASSVEGKPIDFDQIINLPENKKVLSRLKQADDDDNDE